MSPALVWEFPPHRCQDSAEPAMVKPKSLYIASLQRLSKKKNKPEHEKQPAIYVDPELVRDELIKSIQNSNQFAGFVISIFTLMGLVGITMVQIPLSEMFEAASSSRKLIENVELAVEFAPPGQNGINDVANVDQIYDWVLQLHKTTAEIDWVSNKQFEVAENSLESEREEHRVFWDAAIGKYRIPSWMEKFVVNQRSWVVAGWQLKQERLAIQLCDSENRTDKKVGTTLTAI